MPDQKNYIWSTFSKAVSLNTWFRYICSHSLQDLCQIEELGAIFMFTGNAGISPGDASDRTLCFLKLYSN